ncbi:hypothetical protein [Vibrio harveyi]|uniref:Uncharacterized protein n=1 Tax=Vibrio harveyi TaxID=669 RepID=A0A8B3DMH3_VIBHA|nr:hypothetical protein [Vibrio harveyi]RIW17925.1 hypothetical protein DS957_003930 [Vibrio harveyi]
MSKQRTITNERAMLGNIEIAHYLPMTLSAFKEQFDVALESGEINHSEIAQSAHGDVVISYSTSNGKTMMCKQRFNELNEA